MIRCVRMWTGEDGDSLFEEGWIDLAQDNSGTGHTWRLIGDDPWRRAYVVYENGADLHFKPASTADQP
jgi:hypothetical protein